MAGLPSSGSLQKAYLKIGQPGDNNRMGSVEKTIEFMFNPKEISVTKTANYSTPPAGESSQPQYLGTKPQAITVEMFFDASEKGDVTSKIEDLFKALSPHPSTEDEHPTPSFCKFGWGTQTFISNAVIKSAAVKYTRFKPDGTPIRAIATVSLEELPPVKTAPNPTSGSPDSNVERIVHPGDTLASIANQELGSPTLWRVVAEANAVDDPFRIAPGTSLIIPSLTARSRTAELMARPTVSSAFKVEVEGQPLPTELDLASADVESHLHLPDSFTLTFRDRTRTALSKSHLKIGAKVKISVASEATTSPETLLEGEVTAVEAELYSGVSLTIVRGYDQSHRLHRGRVTEGYLNTTYSSVAKQVAGRHDLDLGTVHETTDSHDHIAQANESDWSFLSRLAAEIGYELTVADKALNFRKPPTSAGAPDAHDLKGNDPLTLRPNKELRFIRTSVTAAEQVKEIEAVAWNVQEKKVVSATAPTETDSTRNGSTSAAVAKVFPSPSFVMPGLMLTSDTQAEQAAKAAADRMAASHTEIEGEANGNPKLKAGVAIKLALLGEPFDGKYVLTTTRHSFDVHDGYVTRFTVSGRQERSLLSLTGGSTDADSTISGVVPAVVDDVDDPEHLGRVRLKLPWLGDKYVTDWCPTVHVGAGAKRGLWVLPEAGDQVLVAFEQGDPRRPYVLGGLYSDKDKPAAGPDPLIDGTSKHVNNRVFTSRRGHQLLMVDSDKDASVVVQSSNKKLTIRLDEVKKKIVIDANGDLELHAGGDLKLTARGEVSVKGRAITTEAQTAWKATGKPIQLN